MSSAGAAGPLIETANLVKTYHGPAGPVEVLKGLDLAVLKGESVALVGSSGVGKSTLLHLLGALDRPTSGSIRFEGREVTGLGEGELAAFRNASVGFVFQFHHLLPEFSAAENVMMPCLVGGLSRHRAVRRAERLLDRVGLSDRLEHRIGEMSGGEQQRVALARALVMSPRLLLADEPTGNLDVETGRRVGELLVELNHQLGLTTLVATHNPDFARSMDRLVTLTDGRTFEDQETSSSRGSVDETD